jgi:hypothetical protein
MPGQKSDEMSIPLSGVTFEYDKDATRIAQLEIRFQEACLALPYALHIITTATAAVAPLGRVGARGEECWFLIDHFYDVGSVLLTSRCAYSKPGVEDSFIAQFGPKKRKKKQTAPNGDEHPLLFL